MTIMKIKNIFLTPALAVASSACSDWFDVSPKTDIKTDDLFKDETGFQSALTGCYGNMTKDKTYGKNLTWYFLEKLVQRYDDGSAPFAGQSEHVYDYTNANYSKGIITDIWNSMYETIANVNNLIARLDKNGQEVITTPGSWELMKGEALALRAFLHFDLLRMYGPVYKEEPEKECIPYRKEFKPETSPLLSASKVLELVLADLKEADTYLAQDSVNWGNDAENPFKAYRGHRMNKYAAKALQARVLLYRGGSEDLAEAGRIAKEVIGQCGLKLVRDNFQDIAMFDETLFALHMDDMEDRLESYFNVSAADDGSALWITPTNAEGAFEVTSSVGRNDIRYKFGYGLYNGGTKGLMCRKYLPTQNYVYKENLPLIRLGEMYLIAAEATGDAEYLNDLRNARGISAVYDLDEVTETALDAEYRKEFFAEGQYFYFLKRHAMKTFYRCPPSLEGKMSSFQYVFPLTDDEKEYN